MSDEKELLKAQKKHLKFLKLVDEVAEYIAGHDYRNMHYLRDDEIIEHFSYYKKKHVKRAIFEVR